MEEPSLETNFPLAPYSDLIDKKITGAIQNVTDTTFSYVAVEFIIYDSSGNQLGTAIDSISSFKGGKIWRFEAMELIDMAEVSSFEFLEITYY